jgi:hypothetical protein
MEDQAIPTDTVTNESPQNEVPQASESSSSSYKPGDFSFVENKLHRYMLHDTYTALDTTKLWDFIKDVPINSPDYLEKNPEILELFLTMKYKAHSIDTFGVVLRNMRKIAEVGWDAYVAEWLATKDK